MIEELLELILLKWEKRVKKKREDSFFSFRRENLEDESEIGKLKERKGIFILTL